MAQRRMKITYTLSQIDGVAREILGQSKARIFLLEGPMGTGKTTLIKALLKQLNVQEAVTSPTFSIVNEYQSSEHQRIYHFDLYRIKNSEELLQLGIEEYIEHGDYVFIEWPELARELIQFSSVQIQISASSDEKRTLKLV